MDELAQCYNVLPQLDINNTIDHRPEGDEQWFLENEKTVTQFCRKLAAERPLKDIRDEYNYPKKKGIKDECSRLLEASTMKSRRGFAIQRLMNAMRQAHFFFSSRRRHTRYFGDWSSDVCSSDLVGRTQGFQRDRVRAQFFLEANADGPACHAALFDDLVINVNRRGRGQRKTDAFIATAARDDREIGRASCRERG